MKFQCRDVITFNNNTIIAVDGIIETQNLDLITKLKKYYESIEENLAEETVNLEQFTNSELRKMLTEKNIQFNPRMTKIQLIDLLK